MYGLESIIQNLKLLNYFEKTVRSRVWCCYSWLSLKSLIIFSSMSNEEVPVLVPQTLRDSLKQYNQEHVLTFIDNGTVTGSSATDLLDQLNLLDLSFLQNIFQASTSEDTADSIQASDSTRIEPLDTFHALDESSHEDQVAWREMGLAALCRGTVAAIVLSGGQGTRLGFAGPKGMYDIGLPSGKTLFELFALRLLRLNTLTCSNIPWYIMTSPMNHETTLAFFKEHQYFGLPTESVMMFPQGTLPCFTKEGKLILETPCRLAQASDGNGGIYTALYKSGALADMQKRGILYAHAFAVDNAACKVADPIFIGYCIAREADVGNKVVWKSSSAEKVGIVAKRGGKYCVVEYSEMDEETKALKDVKTGKLVYGAGNICNHFYTVYVIPRLRYLGILLIYD